MFVSGLDVFIRPDAIQLQCPNKKNSAGFEMIGNEGYTSECDNLEGDHNSTVIIHDS